VLVLLPSFITIVWLWSKGASVFARLKTYTRNSIMTLRFTKMHGLGNDFVVFDGVNQKVMLTQQRIAELAVRETGIGFDQCLLVEKSLDAGVDFFYRIFNSDGHEVGQCGNGARCLARFLQHYELTNKRLITVATATTHMQLRLNDDDTVTVEMDRPKLAPADIPLTMPKQAIYYTLPISETIFCDVHAINLGNPHAVMVVSDLESIDIDFLGKKICEHPLFPKQVNVGFMQIIDSHQIRLRVYERGCGETRACGSGAVAAVAIGRLYHELAEQVGVNLIGGNLTVGWPSLDGPIYLTGPATFVYEGKIDV
jgi:diaminopimelate epimerase